MSKQQRHEKRKVERTRRRALIRNPQSAIRNGAAALAAAAVIAAGTQAYASPVRYENTAGFNWTASAGQDVLDVTLDSASQPGVFNAAGTFDISSYYGRVLHAAGPSGGAQRASYGGYNFLVGVGSGDVIPTAGLSFGISSYIYSTYPYAPIQSALPEGQQTYLGVRFDLGGGLQYGWIGVERTGMELDAFAWGYETTPGVPIPAGIPEPGTLALLAFGALALARRRA